MIKSWLKNWLGITKLEDRVYSQQSVTSFSYLPTTTSYTISVPKPEIKPDVTKGYDAPV